MPLVSPPLPSTPPCALLFVPGDRPERFEKAAAAGADAVIIDLEDAVAPAAKPAARRNLRASFTDLPVYVRVNAIGTPWHEEDMAAVAGLPVAGIMLPKAAAGAAFDRLAASPLSVIALIESASGLASARVLAAHDRVARLAFGSIDYAADLGCAHAREPLLSARCEVVLASRLAGRPPPVDGVTADIRDPAVAADDAQHARTLGFAGKLCIHPAQIAAVRRGFAPSDDEIAWARKVLATGAGVAVLEGAMIDAPVRLRAEAMLSRLRDRDI